ncbi:tRNA (cmo5U34)-methyltransferase [Rhizobium sp. UGM030330-04]|nr:tRNA (cmo5U34)-methyltransferase [Rhizobium sp. UGM030330-04]
MGTFDGRQADYIEGARRNVPGLDGLHRMAGLLLAERVPQDGRVLVVGAGGGLELKALSEQQSGWKFDGVDPSSDMLALAQKTIGNLSERTALHNGNISVAPAGPFDGAVCLLVFHHISPEDRKVTLDGIRQRLRPGSPFVLAHVSFPLSEPAYSTWIERHVKFGASSQMDADRRNAAKIGMRKAFIRSPEEEREYLQEAGFTSITQFYQAISFRGWVAYA